MRLFRQISSGFSAQLQFLLCHVRASVCLLEMKIDKEWMALGLKRHIFQLDLFCGPQCVLISVERKTQMHSSLSLRRRVPI